MKIELITKENYDLLIGIYKNFPELSLQNKEYEGPQSDSPFPKYSSLNSHASASNRSRTGPRAPPRSLAETYIPFDKRKNFRTIKACRIS